MVGKQETGFWEVSWGGAPILCVTQASLKKRRPTGPPPEPKKDCENRAYRNSPSIAVALN
jgi:hypothetical protein